MNFLRYFVYALVIIGALNWGLIGMFGFNLVSLIFGDMTLLARIIYSLVGISAVASLFMQPNCDIHNDEYCKCDI